MKLSQPLPVEQWSLESGFLVTGGGAGLFLLDEIMQVQAEVDFNFYALGQAVRDPDCIKPPPEA